MKLAHLVVFIFTLVFAVDAAALPSIKENKNPESPTLIKADNIDGDRVNNLLIATGHVEANKGSSTIYANQMTYKKGSGKGGGVIHAIGNVEIKNIEAGSVFATSAEIRDDFSRGKFFNSKLFFLDGSYLTSPQIERQEFQVTVLRKSIFSICPNPEIQADKSVAGKKRDMISIKSSKALINREDQTFKVNNAIIRLYDVPLLYVPYLKSALPSKKRQSGFLYPSYSKSTNLGTRIVTPYYFNIAPNIDLLTSPYFGIGNNNQILVNNELRHFTTYGEYSGMFEIANNKIQNLNDRTIVRRTSKAYRWNLTGKGVFDFTHDVGMDFELNMVSDSNFLRDYHNYYLNFALSKVNFDYIHGRNYHSVKVVKIQELENFSKEDMEQTAVPAIDSHIETKPIFFKGKLALTSNATNIVRSNGLQYRRITTVPEFNLPFNLGGNLFAFNTKLQGDLYSLENNYKENAPLNSRYKNSEYNYRPEVSFNWKLPLMKKAKNNSFLVEPMVNIVSSSYGRNFNLIPNEDSNSSELTVSNLFINDRIYGFDRNEGGTRVTYGVKTSLFNKYGEFGMTVGQSYRKTEKVQDAVIRGFNGEKKSNIVGQIMYKSQKHFSVIYAFQLDESSYRNDVNEVTANLIYDKFTLNSNYLLIKKSKVNLVEKEQISFGGTVKISKKWDAAFTGVKDLIDDRFIRRSVIFSRNGCCTIFGINISETNPANLNEPQRSFGFNLTFKNL